MVPALHASRSYRVLFPHPVTRYIGASLCFALTKKKRRKLLAHPVTQPWVSDVDQLALSYLESVTVHKASSSAATNAQQKDAGGAAVGGSADGDEGRKKQGGEGGQELGDDDDVGFRVTFVSTPCRCGRAPQSSCWYCWKRSACATNFEETERDARRYTRRRVGWLRGDDGLQKYIYIYMCGLSLVQGSVVIRV